MTREEIGQDAEGIVRTACNLQRNVGLSDANAAVETKLIVLVRATLEGTARAVCVDCRDGIVLRENKMGRATHWIHEDEEGDPCPCYASEIHDLIAKLDKEVPGE